MIINKLSIITLTVVTVFITSCEVFKSEPKPETIISYVPQEFKDYTVFKEGSWWIYQDSASGLLDTLTISHYGTGFRDYDNLIGNNEFELFSNVIYIKDSNEYIFNTTPFLEENPTSHQMYFQHRQAGSFPLFIWPESGKMEDTEPFAISTFYDEFNGFENVIKSEITNFSYNGVRERYARFNPFDIIWFAPNIGAVKYKFTDSTVYNLIDYNIVQ